MLYDNRWDLDAVGKVLWDAADHMQQYGWCRYSLYRSTGEVCVLGALEAVAGNGRTFYATRRIVSFLGNASGVTQWNDRICRNADEAVALLRGAARHKEQ